MSDHPFNTVSGPSVMQYHTSHGSGMCDCTVASRGFVLHKSGCPMELPEVAAIRAGHALDMAFLRQRYADFMADHLDNDHHWDEYAFEGDGVEYMEAAHKTIHEAEGA